MSSSIRANRFSGTTNSAPSAMRCSNVVGHVMSCGVANIFCIFSAAVGINGADTRAYRSISWKHSFNTAAAPDISPFLTSAHGSHRVMYSLPIAYNARRATTAARNSHASSAAVNSDNFSFIWFSKSASRAPDAGTAPPKFFAINLQTRDTKLPSIPFRSLFTTSAKRANVKSVSSVSGADAISA